MLAERLRSAVPQADVKAGGKVINLTAGFGVTGFDETTPDDQLTQDNMIKRADGLLYQARESGRNKVVSGMLVV